MSQAMFREDGQIYRLNQALVAKQGISVDCVRKIEAAHNRLTAHITAMNALSNEDPALKEMATGITAMEFELQALWGFKQDPAFHIHWVRPLACLCPKTANESTLQGEPKRIVHVGCPLHADTTVEGVETITIV